MRIIHTADWHLGKIVNNFSMLEDQTYYFNQMIAELEEINPDVLVMAGDLYDRTNPPKEAVTLANSVFTRLINDLGIKVIVISGNHDSPERVAYGSELLERSGLFIEGIAEAETKKVEIEGVNFWLAPFLDPVTARQTLENDDLRSYEDVAVEQVRRMRERMDSNSINILIYHGFLVSGDADSVEESDSERPLTIGTAEYIPVSTFDDFDYVMLGHLHKGQKVGKETVRYSGSPLKYSKSEANHRKGFDVIDIVDGDIKREKVEINPLHDLRVIRGDFAELIKESSNDYVFAELTDNQTVLEAMSRLRKQYPNIMELQYINLQKISNDAAQQHTSQTLKNKSTIDLFEDFYNQYSETKLSDQQREYVIDTIKEGDKA